MISQSQLSSGVANVISKPENNTYQSVTSSNNKQEIEKEPVHTRIYEYLATTIKLDEMSIPIVHQEDSNATIDSSTKLHVDANNINENIYITSGNKSVSQILTTGFVYPLLRINDHYFSSDDIKYFSLETVGFIPTIEVILECGFNDILKANLIKDGDICSVFINPGHGTIKSYRGDFLITHVKVPQMNMFNIERKIKVKFI